MATTGRVAADPCIHRSQITPTRGLFQGPSLSRTASGRLASPVHLSRVLPRLGSGSRGV
jgi:hypothetical protein